MKNRFFILLLVGVIFNYIPCSINAQPQPKSNWNEAGYGYAEGVFVSGNYVYLASSNSGQNTGLQIIDISDPSAPTFKGSVNISENAYDVWVQGNYAYLAARDGLFIINISNPSLPTTSGVFPTEKKVQGIYISGIYAYIAAEAKGIYIVNIEDPFQPYQVGYYDTPVNAYDVMVKGRYLYVADGLSGLQILDIIEPSNPTFVGSYDTPHQAVGIYISGNYVYVADYEAGVRIIDISVPSNPQEVGFLDTEGRAENTYIIGNYVYVADNMKGIRIIDITNKTLPSEITFYDPPEGFAMDVKIYQGRIYVADYNKGLSILEWDGLVDAAPSPPVWTENPITSGDGQITLNWQANTEEDFAGYNVYRSTTQGSNYTKINTALLTLTQFTDTNLTNGITYYYILKAQDIQGNESNASSEVFATPQDTTPPTNITTLPALSLTKNSITLNWIATGDDGNIGTATSYDIRYSTLNITDANWADATQVNNEPAPKIAGSSETFTITGLSPDTTYYFAIKVVDEVPNASGLSNVVSAKTPFAEITFQLPAGISIVSIPIQPLNSDPKNIFQIAENELKLARWDPKKGTNDKYEYYPHIFVKAIKPGEGFWIKLDAIKNITVGGTLPTTSFELPLYPGWNQIGNPFNKDILWGDNIKVKHGNETKTISEAARLGWTDIYMWTKKQGNWKLIHPNKILTEYNTTNKIESWVGYWMRAHIECKLIINEVSPKIKDFPEYYLPDGLTVNIIARAGNQSDVCTVGISHNPKERCLTKPPKDPAPYIYIYSLGEEGKQASNLKEEKQITIFDIVLEKSNQDESIEIEFKIEGLKDETKISFIDIKTKEKFDLKNTKIYKPLYQDNEYYFQVKVEKEKHSPFELLHTYTYPNPARGEDINFALEVNNPSAKYLQDGIYKAKVEIYTIAGRKIGNINLDNNFTQENLGASTRLKRSLKQGVDFPSLVNGAYIYKIIIIDKKGEQIIKKTNKIVILR